MTKSDRKPPRRVSRQTSRQRRHIVRFTAVGIFAVVAVAAVVLLVMNLTSAGTGAGATNWSVAPYTGGPRLAVDHTEIDDGPVAYNHEVNATYHLKNVGDKQLTLQTPTVEIVEGC